MAGCGRLSRLPGSGLADEAAIGPPSITSSSSRHSPYLRSSHGIVRNPHPIISAPALHRFRALRRAALKFAVPIGRGRSQGGAMIWAPKPELMCRIRGEP